MDHNSRIIDLKNTFSEDHWAWIFPALRQDEIVWGALNNPDFRGLAINKFGSHPKNWSPLNLACLPLGENLAFSDLQTAEFETLPATIQAKSQQAFEQIQTQNPPKNTLPEMGLLAIYAHCHPEQTLPKTKTLLACLLGLQAEPLPFLKKLNPGEVIHVLLSNPMPPAELSSITMELITSQSDAEKLSLLQALARQRPELAAQLTDTITQDPASFFFQPDAASFDYDPQIKEIAKQKALTELFTIAQQPKLQSEHALQAWEQSKALQTRFCCQIVKDKIQKGQANEAVRQLEEIRPLSPDSTQTDFTEVIFALHQQENLKLAPNWLLAIFADFEGPDRHPNFYLAAALILQHQGKLEDAVKAAHQAVNACIKSDKNLAQQITLIELLIALKQTQAALDILNSEIADTPNDAKLIRLAIQINQEIGENDDAIQYAYLASVLEPENISHRRDLANLLEENERWEQAFRERQSVLERQGKPETSDLIKLSTCAINAQQPQKAAEVGERIIQVEPQNGDIHHLLGNAYTALGNPKKAQASYQKATQFIPTDVAPWLALAKILGQTNQSQKALETLQIAAQTITNSPEIQLALGEIYTQNQANTQALEAFRKANSIAKTIQSTTPAITIQTATSFGKSLLALGHLAEAKEILSEAHNDFPENAAIAHQYAKVLLANQTPAEAIIPLRVALESKPAEPEIRLDYAKALLAIPQDIGQARDMLLDIREQNPGYPGAVALLAEAYEANQELELALDTYQEAWKSELRENFQWMTKLSQGLSRVALQLDQPETAIATLKLALSKNGQEKESLKLLSTAYLAANLEGKALSTARQVLEIDPNDLENLDWFIKRAVTLENTEEAVKALNAAIGVGLHQADLRIKLGWIHQFNGDFEAAKDQFEFVADLEGVPPSVLFSAAQGLLAINHAQAAIQCLEKTIYISENTHETDCLPQYLSTLADIYHQLDNLSQSLEILERAIQLSPDDPALLEKKMILRIKRNEIPKAIEEIEGALASFPHDSALRLQAAEVYRIKKDFSKASHNIQIAMDCTTDEDGNFTSIPVVSFAADLADSLLKSNQAQWILDRLAPGIDASGNAALPLHCLRGEIAFDRDEEIAAANALTAAIEIDPEHPRVLALQARVTSRQGDFDSAQKFFNQALEKAGNKLPNNPIHLDTKDLRKIAFLNYSPATFIAIAETALLLQHWSIANFLLKRAIEIAPNEPRTHFRLAKALVLRAEFQRICEIINVTNHAPGVSATAEFAYEQFEDSILKTANLVTKQISQSQDHSATAYNKPKDTIAVWHGRGQAVFQPSCDHAHVLQKFTAKPDAHAAYIAALRLCGDLDDAAKEALRAVEIHQEKSVEPKLFGQIAITLARSNPDAALKSAQTAIDISIQQNLPFRPIYHGILAFVAHRVQNPLLHLQAIESAIALWPDEPQWLVLAADLAKEQHVGAKNARKSLHYLAQAVQLEPQNDQLFMKYGLALLESGKTHQALQAFESAARITPEKTQPWIALAKTYKGLDDNSQVVRCATQALQSDPLHPDANLLLAEVHLSTGDIVKASDFLDTVLQKYPDHPEALILKAKTLTSSGKHDKALRSLDRAVLHLNDPIPLQIERVNLIQQAQGDLPALKEIQNLAEKYPENPVILAKLAEYLWIKGELDQAITTAQDAVNLAPNQLGAEAYVALLQLLGKLMRSTGQQDQAIHYLSEAIRIDSGNSLSYLELGRSYHARRQYPLAIETFQKACAMDPTDPESYYQAGIVYKEQKDFSNAEIMFRKAANLAPHNLNIHRQLGAVTAVNLVQNRTNQPRFVNSYETIDG